MSLDKRVSGSCHEKVRVRVDNNRAFTTKRSATRSLVVPTSICSAEIASLKVHYICIYSELITTHKC